MRPGHHPTLFRKTSVSGGLTKISWWGPCWDGWHCMGWFSMACYIRMRGNLLGECSGSLSEMWTWTSLSSRQSFWFSKNLLPWYVQACVHENRKPHHDSLHQHPEQSLFHHTVETGWEPVVLDLGAPVVSESNSHPRSGEHGCQTDVQVDQDWTRFGRAEVDLFKTHRKHPLSSLVLPSTIEAALFLVLTSAKMVGEMTTLLVNPCYLLLSVATLSLNLSFVLKNFRTIIQLDAFCVPPHARDREVKLRLLCPDHIVAYYVVTLMKMINENVSQQ